MGDLQPFGFALECKVQSFKSIAFVIKNYVESSRVKEVTRQTKLSQNSQVHPEDLPFSSSAIYTFKEASQDLLQPKDLD